MRPWTADIYGYPIPRPSSWAGEESVTTMSFPVWRDIGAHCSHCGQDCWALGQPQVWWLCFLRRSGLILIRPPVQQSGGKEPRCRPCWAEAALVCCLEKLCTERDSKPAHGMETPGDWVWAGKLPGASLVVFPVLSKKLKVPICSTILTSNSPDLKNGLPSGGRTASTCEAQQTGLLLAFWHLLEFAQPTSLLEKKVA